MLKNILNLNGTQELSNNEQKTIKGSIGGGYTYCDIDYDTCLAKGGKWNIYQEMCVIKDVDCY